MKKDYPETSYKTLLGLVLTVLMLFAVGAVGTQATEQATEEETGDGVYTAEQAERGQEAYEQHCAQCHGLELEGGGHFPPLTGDRFWQRWEERSVWELYEFTHDNMPLGQGGSLPEETYADIIAFQLSHYGYPEGEEELEPDQESLEQIMLEPQEDEGVEDESEEAEEDDEDE